MTFVEQNCFPIDTTYYVNLVAPETTDIRYIYNVLKTLNLPSLRGGAGIPGLNRKEVYEKYKIPLPPFAIQQEIVAEIEVYQKIIDGARQVVENYKPRIDMRPEWPMVELGEVCEDFMNGVNFSKEQVGSGTKFVNIKDVFSDGYVNCDALGKVSLSENEIKRKLVKTDDLIFVRSSVKEEGVGFASLMGNYPEEVVFCGFLIKCSPIQRLAIPRYLHFLLRTGDFRKKVVALSNKANITNISQDNLKSLVIPIPDLETQRAIVAEIEAEQRLVEAAKELTGRFEAKIKAAIGRVWGDGAEERPPRPNSGEPE